MKRVYLIALFTLLFTTACFSQAINNISTRCPSPNRTVFSSVRAAADGDIDYTPCPSRSSIFTGLVDFSGATVTGLVSGSGTTNFIPRWTAASTLGNTPNSWNGANYIWNNTGLNATFLMLFTPSTTGTGVFSVGSTTDSIAVNEGNNVTLLSTVIDLNSGNGLTNIGDITGANSGTLITLDDATELITIGDPASDAQITVTDAIGINGVVTLGDTAAAVNGTREIIDDANGTIELGKTSNGRAIIRTDEPNKQVSLGDVNAVTNSTLISVDDSTRVISLSANANAGITVDGAGSDVTLFAGDDAILAGSDLTTIGITADTSFSTTQSSNTFSFLQAGIVGVINAQQVNNWLFLKTVTAAGTTGNRTINQPSGSVNIAAAGTNVVITNNTVTTSSTIFSLANTNDATCAVKNAVPTANTITITMTAACTAETRVTFLVIN